MRKRVKKLFLKKETLINLEFDRLTRAAHGGTAETMFCGPTQLTCGCGNTDACGLTEGMLCTLNGCTAATN